MHYRSIAIFHILVILTLNVQVRKPNRQQTMQSVAPARTLVGPESNDDIYKKIDNSLVQNYIEGDSYMAKVSGGGMTNARALQVSCS
jgi:FKBP12-rapamycin complex-associated protein